MKRPSADDLLMLSEHLLYEVKMTFFLAQKIDMGAGTVLDVPARNADIESFAIHLRQLVKFVWVERSRDDDDDVYAADCFDPGEWNRLRPPRPDILDGKLSRRVGWGVAHLTVKRAWVEPKDRWFEVREFAIALAPPIVCFADAVDAATFSSGCADLIGDVARSYQTFVGGP